MSSADGDSSARTRPTRTPKCSRCRNHGLLVPVRGHSGHCLWKLCTCPKCALISERHKLLAAHKLLRRSGSKAASPEDRGTVKPECTEDTGRGQPPRPLQAAGHPRCPPECVQSLDYFERETTRMYLGCPPLFHYPTLGLPPPGFRGAALPAPGIPFRSLRPYHPLPVGGRDFHQGYYPPMPPFIPPGYMSGMHYLPPAVPMNMLAERAMAGQISGDHQSFRVVSQRSETPNKEQSA